MKLVVRSPYWGRILRGKTRRNYDYGAGGRTYRVIACQAVLSAMEGQFWGCCPHHGKRVLELKEYHFTDHFSGDWDLYMVGFSVTTTYAVHAFFLLPQNQTTIDLSQKMSTQGWTYVGTANASVIRLELDAMLGEILKQNESMGFRYHHVHLEILMDQVFDRETPRSRKAAIEKARSDRDTASIQQDSSTASPTAATATVNTEVPGSVPPPGLESSAQVPPIPSVVSNDATWLSDSNSTMSAHENLTSAWGPPTPYEPSHHYHHQPHGHHHPHRHQGGAPYHPQNWYSSDHVQWVPASMSQGVIPQSAAGHQANNNILPPMSLPQSTTMNPAQQLLYQGFVPGSNTPLPQSQVPPTGYLVPAAALAPYPGSNQPLQGYPVMDPYLRRYSESPSELQVLDGSSGDVDEAAVGGTSGHSVDEKFNEDIATASFSDSTDADDVGEDSLAAPEPPVAA